MAPYGPLWTPYGVLSVTHFTFVCPTTPDDLLKVRLSQQAHENYVMLTASSFIKDWVHDMLSHKHQGLGP
jgi:hypothetical protein